MRKFVPIFALAGAATSVSSVAHALPLCSALPTYPIVYIENGDTQEPLVKRLGQQLINDPVNPIRIVYKNEPTCTLRNDMMVNAATPGVPRVAADRNMNVDATRANSYIPDATEAAMIGWDPSKLPPACDLDIAGSASSNPITLAIGATFLSSCAATTQPTDIGVLTGPVQSYGFIVPPTGANQVAITAEEGFFAFGYANGDGQAPPWTDTNLRFTRAATASTALVLSAAIGLTAAQLKGTPQAQSSNVVSLVNASPTPDQTIGLLGTEVFDADRSKVKLLAFKGFGQRFAYFPDKTNASFDKQNVRDGHYLPWAPTPYITTVDGAGVPTNANAKRIIDLIIDLKDETNVKAIDSVIASGLVPECAMKVQRAFEGGELSKYSPAERCGCYFESKVPQGTTKCAACTTDATCGAGKCRRGFCEAK